jgi:uncharacterized SAM-binding protein YcdF (DUF218 family)
MKKFWLYTSAIIFLLTLLAYLFRVSILVSFSEYLQYSDSLTKADAIFVLGGNPFDRPLKAVEIYKSGYAGKVICTGGNTPLVIKALNLEPMVEADLSKNTLMKQGVDSIHIVALRKGTSTKEESEEILNYCKENGYKKIIIVSDKFHTSRVNKVFRKFFKNEGIDIIISGSPSSVFNEQEWWKSEEGLIAINNEYIKHIYYFIKY